MGIRHCVVEAEDHSLACAAHGQRHSLHLVGRIDGAQQIGLAGLKRRGLAEGDEELIVLLLRIDGEGGERVGHSHVERNHHRSIVQHVHIRT